MLLKALRKYRMFVICILILFLSFVFPVKFCVDSLDLVKKEQDFIVVKYYDHYNSWLLVGNYEGMFDEQTMVDYPVSVENHDPKKIVSGDLYTHNRNTYFIIYGTAIRKESRYTIENNQWNILGDIDSRNSFRLNFSRKYLTIYGSFQQWWKTLRKCGKIEAEVICQDGRINQNT